MWSHRRFPSAPPTAGALTRAAGVPHLGTRAAGVQEGVASDRSRLCGVEGVQLMHTLRFTEVHRGQEAIDRSVSQWTNTKHTKLCYKLYIC
jgi:hypothetical protein